MVLPSPTTPSREWPRRRLILGRHHEEFNYLRAQCVRKLFEDGDRGVFQTPLNPAHVSPINTGIDRKTFLRKILANANSSKISRDKRLRPHAKRQAPCGPLNHGLLSYD